MSLSRRRFLEVGSLVAASSALPLQGAASSAAQGVLSHWLPGDSLHGLTIKQAEELVGLRFFVDAGLGRPLQMDLVSVEGLPRCPGDCATGEAYVLNFQLVRGTTVPQGTYIFSSERSGRCPLLIVPSGPKTRNYAAVINHRRPLRG